MREEIAALLSTASIILVLVGLSNIDVAFNRYHLAYWTKNRELPLITDRSVFGDVQPIDVVYARGQLQCTIGVGLVFVSIALLLVKNKSVKNKVKL